jgi:hypothetical protein
MGPVILIASFAVAGSKSAKSKCCTTSYGAGGRDGPGVAWAGDVLRKALSVKVPTCKQFLDLEKLWLPFSRLSNISWSKYHQCICEMVSVEKINIVIVDKAIL